ncbi:hypothetical protein HG530_014569 [Fusarium avenaceum]|nr:hypothetical protein HG530_014569 [Fusarium avenaceum]
MVYSPNANTLLRARQLQRLHAHSTTTSILPSNSPTNEADWDPNWTTTKGSLSTTIRHFVKAAEESLKDPALARRRTLFEPAPPSTLAEEEKSNTDAPVAIPGDNQTASTVRDLEREARSQAAELAERDERIAVLQSQLEDMQSPMLCDLQTQLDEAEQSMSELRIGLDKTKEELRLEKTRRAYHNHHRSGPRFNPRTRRSTVYLTTHQYNTQDQSSDEDERPSESLPYYHSLHIPLMIGNTGDTHTLKICIHPNWRIKGTSSTIHLHNLEATLKNETEHDGRVLALGYDVADLWGMWVGLDEELFQIKLGLATWNASKLPGPGAELFTLLEKSQNCIPDSSAFNALWRSAAKALKGGIAEIIADRIEESNSALEIIQQISLYWNITSGENSEVMQSLRVLYDKMVNLDAIETFLIQSKKGFERQSSHPKYAGLSTSPSIQDMLDAITHTITHINPYTSPIPPLLSRALEKLTFVNETIAAQNQIWNALLLGRGVVERDVLGFDNRWLLSRTRCTAM